MRKRREALMTAAAVSILGMLSSGCPGQGPPKLMKQGHGTINIVFANQNGLVALTDTMLSFDDGRHEPNHQKLFKIDDKTICTMAGSYSAPGIEGIAEFYLWIPNIINGFAAEQQRVIKAGVPLGFARKFERLKVTFEHQLTSNLQAYLHSHPDTDIAKVQPIELTLAGYDIDGVLKVGEITLTPERTEGGIDYKTSGLPVSGNQIPTCELRSGFDANALYDAFGVPKPRVIANGLFCEVAGIPEGVAEIEAVLNQPPPDALPSLRVYAAAEKAGRVLSIDDLEALASDLETQLAMQETQSGARRVGGEQNVAVLRNGQVEKAPEMNQLLPQAGTALNKLQVRSMSANCSTSPDLRGFVMGEMPEGVELSLVLQTCRIDLRDRVLYHDSQFIDSYLIYAGNGPLRFDGTNQVPGTTLTLGGQVDLTRSDVKSLMCDFPWKAVYKEKQGIHPACK